MLFVQLRIAPQNPKTRREIVGPLIIYDLEAGNAGNSIGAPNATGGTGEDSL